MAKKQVKQKVKGEHSVKSEMHFTSAQHCMNKNTLSLSPDTVDEALTCSCGSDDFKIFTNEESDKFKDIVVVCVNCGLTKSLKTISESIHYS
jgi:hypothetical protein